MPEHEENLLNDPELIQDFVTETTELLERLDEDLVLLETCPDDQELINRVFRSIHTIKGTSAFLGYENLVNVCHSAEEVLNRVRKGELHINVPILNILLEAIDLIRALVEQLKTGSKEPIDTRPTILKLERLLQESQGEERMEEAETEQPPAETPGKPSAVRERKTDDETLRIRKAHIDDLINLVGELVIERNRLLQLYRTLGVKQEGLSESIERLSYIVSELQMSILKVRMLPIARLFRRFPRVVRDLAHDLGKEVQLHISGEDAELDKSMVDELYDPLVHLLRNAVYHGIEPPEERVKLGKDRTGHLYLSAEHENNHLVIRVRDDGRGLQIEKITQRAIERGLISADRLHEMKEEEIIHLIFQPGFSTAEKADDVSGRGVGLDVVHNQIKRLNGIIEIHSEPGKGCEFNLKLPLTLAIIQALLVESAGEIFAVPLSSVVEILKIDRNAVHQIGAQQTLLHRGRVLPLVNLSEALDLRGNGKESKGEYVLVIGIAEKRYGLRVDRLHGQEEVVIKPLGSGMPSIAGLAGSMITGDGRVRFIVEPSQLV
jgi:two-component system chemotaxis sensor kinase CheA